LFRLRLFVNPDPNYSDTGGAIQSLSYDIALAQQIKADCPNANIMLDLHYSDTWADPGHQATPAAWTGQSLSTLQTTVQTYTYNTLMAFQNAGVMPKIVQVGNETNGMLWPVGEINYSGTTAQQQASWQAFGSLIKAGIAGVREAQGSGPAIQIALHPGGADTLGYFFSQLTDPSYGDVPLSSFDIMGASFYPNQSGAIGTLQGEFTSAINTFGKKVMVLETNNPWNSGDSSGDPDYPATPIGQLDFLSDLDNMVSNLPNNAGEGVLWWYPESVPVAGYSSYDGGARALFDSNGNALPAIGAFASVPEPAAGVIGIALFACATLQRPACRYNRRASNQVV
jgi:arabinogalactan endo-1,4-beta-galactosidase